MKSLMIETQRERYPFIVGAGSIDQLSIYIGNGVSKVMLVTDEKVAEHHLASVASIMADHSIAHVEFLLPNGEEAKSFIWLERLLSKAVEAGLDRSSLMIALGGGVVGDVTGFAAAIYMRGIPYLQLPTTVLAHDSSIGGKVAINHPLGKNLIGSFYHPRAVLYDTRFLLTLSDRDYRSGFAEIIKHAIIRDHSLFLWLEEHAERLLQRDLAILEEAIYRSAAIKAEIVKADEREAHVRALLNYGHTIGHALENLNGYQWLHGEAVSIGMIAAARMGEKYLHYDVDVARIKRLLHAFQLPTSLKERVDEEALFAVLQRDKKVKAGQLAMVFPESIGHAVIRRDVEPEWIRSVINELAEE